MLSAPLLIDNQAAIQVARGSSDGYRRLKHIDLAACFLRQRVMTNQDLVVEFCPSKHQLADVMTKPLPIVLFSSLLYWITGDDYFRRGAQIAAATSSTTFTSSRG